jgi:phospholipase/carboxylesterase
MAALARGGGAGAVVLLSRHQAARGRADQSDKSLTGDRMAALLDGPRLEPRSGPARHLVVFLHGYGADGNDLIEIGRAWQTLLPQAAFVSPHAPEPCGQAPTGRQWFPLTFRNVEERWIGVNKAAPVLDAFLDAELARRALPSSALALVGFSQGTMMALHVGLRRAATPAAIVGYSGVFVIPEEIEADAFFGAEIRSRPPVLLVHGDRDDLIPAQALFEAAQTLAALDVPAEWHLSSGIGHGIDQEGLRQGGEFLARRLR